MEARKGYKSTPSSAIREPPASTAATTRGQHPRRPGRPWVRVLLCMEIQRYAAPKLVIKTATTARDLFEAEALSSAGAPLNTIVGAEPLWVVRTKCGPPIAAMSQLTNWREDDAALWGAPFCSCRQCDILAVYSLLASASARWRWSSIFGKVWRANSLRSGSEPFLISYWKRAAFPFW